MENMKNKRVLEFVCKPTVDDFAFYLEVNKEDFVKIVESEPEVTDYVNFDANQFISDNGNDREMLRLYPEHLFTLEGCKKCDKKLKVKMVIELTE